MELNERVHPLSGAFKGSSHPQFSLESRSLKRSSTTTTTTTSTTSTLFSSTHQHYHHHSPPDEEKGRKFKSTTTLPSHLFTLARAAGGAGAGAGEEESTEDDAFERDWMASKPTTGSRLESAWTFEFNKKVAGWKTAIELALEDPSGANGNIELSGQGLTDIPDEVRELSFLTNINNSTSISPRQLTAVRLNGLHLRTQSGPLALGERARSFTRSASGPLNSSVNVDFFLSNNQITSNAISHSLWSIVNTRVLSLRSNRLEFLPEGIGRLSELTTLNISANQISYLPSEILLLKNLSHLIIFPNTLLLPPVITSTTFPKSKHLISPLKIHFTLPSLTELSIRSLLKLGKSFERPTPFPAHLLAPFLTTFDSLPARNSKEEQPFDPLSNICRSPYHPGEEIKFYKPAVERYQWIRSSDICCSLQKEGSVEVEEGVMSVQELEKKNKARVVPIRHRGCSLHCLDWLEEK